MDLTTLEMYDESVTFLQDRLPDQLRCPRVAIICGSGLGLLAETVEHNGKLSRSFDYASVPHLPHPTGRTLYPRAAHFAPCPIPAAAFLHFVRQMPRKAVEGHAGRLVFGLMENQAVVLMSGRSHFYEGHSIEKITYPVRVFRRLGVQTILVTNAAGGLNPDYAVGDIVVLNDHLFLAGLAGNHPLRGPNLDSFGVRFPPLSDAYDLGLRRATHAAWRKSQKDRKEVKQRRLHEGVYAFVAGPSFETRAECRLLRTFGADLVGMSTVPEIIVARHCGLQVLALSLVTNKAVLEAGPRGDDPLLEGATADDLKTMIEKGRASHEEVVEEGRLAALDFQALVTQVMHDIS